jgi:cytochrome c oxidase assembly protein subunit 15
MTSSPGPWLHRLAVFTAIATLALIGIGGLVTSHGVGMAVPDWPNTNGYNMFWFPVSQWVGGIFYEHTHRLTASFVGFLTTILAVWMWTRETRGKARWLGIGAMLAVILLMGVRQLPVYIALASCAPIVVVASLYQIRRNPAALRWWGLMAFAAVILQGVLGGLRVVYLADQIGIFHAALAQLFFVLICSIAFFTSNSWPVGRVAPNAPTNHVPAPVGRVVPNAPHRLMFAATLLILFQLILGATMRHQHAGLAIPDFPLAYGKIWPSMDAASVVQYNQQRLEVTAVNPITAFQIGLQMVHRFLALLIFGAVACCAWNARRRLGTQHPVTRFALVWFGLICAQAMLGVATIWSNKAADIATAHVVIGALSLAAGGMLSIVALRAQVSERGHSCPQPLPTRGSGTAISSAGAALQPNSGAA